MKKYWPKIEKHWLVSPLNIFLIAGISLLIIQHWIPTLLISALYFATRNDQIKSPDFGIIHLFGKALKKVGPGLCLLFPGVHLDKYTGKEFEVHFKNKNALSGQNNIGIDITGTVFLRANPEFTDLDKFLQLSKLDVIEKTAKEASTILETEIVKKKTISKILKNKNDICNAIKENIIDAMGGTFENGIQKGGTYIVKKIYLYGTKAEALTSAAYAREQGEVSAKVAKKLSKVLGKNAYIPQTATEIGLSAVNISTNITKAIIAHKKDSNDITDTINKLDSVMKLLAKKIENLENNHN